MTSAEVNEAACAIAAKVRAARGCLVAGGLTTTGLYKPGRDCKGEVQEVYKRNLATLVSGGVDFIILEFFRNVTELEWAVEVCLGSGLPVGAMLCMGPGGELGGASVEQCAVRIARAGASLVGVNCLFDPQICLTMMERMKSALEDAGLASSTYLMAQPMGWRAPDATSWGHSALPEFPFSLEPRQITRWEARKWAREAYNLGIRYIGGCCGFEPYHIRAMAEELAVERGGVLPEASQKSDHDLAIHAGLEGRGLARYNNKYMYVHCTSTRTSTRTCTIACTSTSCQVQEQGLPGLVDELAAVDRSSSLDSDGASRWFLDQACSPLWGNTGLNRWFCFSFSCLLGITQF